MRDEIKTPQTRKEAINEMCKECIYDPYQKGTWREQVRDCRSTGCPLHPFRPTPYKQYGKKAAG